MSIFLTSFWTSIFCFLACFLISASKSSESLIVRAESFLKKTTYLEIDLRNTEILRKYSQDIGIFLKEIEYQISENQIKSFFVDEIQKLPELLDSIQKLIDKYNVQFILSGSSARKLKRLRANLLGVRAQVLFLHPFNYWELESAYDFEKILKYGDIAGFYDKIESTIQKKLKSYVKNYLKEEIAQEGLVRSFLGKFFLKKKFLK